MSKYKFLGKGVPRVDAKEKVTGEVLYPSDIYMDNQLHIKVLRTKYPYAKILSIDTSEAERYPGVVKVLTHKDIPGTNAFGIAIQDQPVFCYDFVRYQGDAIAAVGSESETISEEALKLIKVEYEVLEPIVEPEFALEPNAPQLHKNGNILNHKIFTKNDINKTLKNADFVSEGLYTTQRQAHCYLETEAGASYFDKEGKLVVHAGGQYPHRDVRQLSRILNIDPDEIRVINSPVGGGFGGKDELSVQAYLGLMTYITKRPSRIMLSREESFIAGGKRHPAKLQIKLGADKNGKLLGIDFYALEDTGGYASLGGPVMNLTVEHAGGVYYFPNSKVEAHNVYTNSGFQVAFRGFGVPQALFALESEMDKLAHMLNIDRLEFRKMNLLERGQTGAMDNEFPLSIGSHGIVDAMLQGEIYKNKDSLIQTNKPHLKRGIGYALGLQGTGLGVGLPDFAKTKFKLTKEGKFKLYLGTSEMGQGNATCFIQIAAEELNCDITDLDYNLGDSEKSLDSGPATASRTIYAVGAATYYAAKNMREAILTHFNGNHLEIKEGVVFIDKEPKLTLQGLSKEQDFEVTGRFDVPTATQCLGDGLPHILYGYSGHITLVEINTLTGETDLIKAECYIDGGTVVNMQGFEGQSEGGLVMGAGYALLENSILNGGYYQNPRFATYILPTALDVPMDIKTIPVEIYEKSNPMGSKGIGEVVFTSVGPAIANAISDALGIRFDSLPITPELIMEKLHEKKQKEGSLCKN